MINGGAPGLAQVGMGCARLGEATGGMSWRDSVALVRSARDGGITFFDTADAYTNGTSERMIGQALGTSRGVTIATKAGYRFRPRSGLEARARFVAGPVLKRAGRRAVWTATQATAKYADQDFSPEYLQSAVVASLGRLRRDHIDLFQLHAPRQVDVRAVDDLAREMISRGLIQHFGVAVESIEQAEPWLASGSVEFLQVPFSVLDPWTAADAITRASSAGIHVIARSVLGTGVLSSPPAGGPPESPHADLIRAVRAIAEEAGTTSMAVAIAFARNQPGIKTVLVGVRLQHHLTQLLDYVGRAELGQDVLERVWATVEQHQRPD